jgi:hypothetical protein
LIAVVDDAIGTALPDGHVQRIQDEARSKVVGHRPADHTATERVDDDGQEQEAGPGWDVRDVGHPELVNGRRGEVALGVDPVPWT